ncbi:putative membrane protein YdfK [bioreactor metagenome]|uniref:Putative membrane protein YdfK n=1 Tax=bioreactor metagenome TaxID=1076179 RepID=A0A645ISZ4_9ZZZZ
MIATIAIVIGGAIGMILDFDGRFNRFVDGLEQKLASKTENGSKFSEAFITTTLLYCVGAMAVVGSLNSGLSGNHEVLFTKSILDGVSAIVFASTLGAGVLLSAIPLFLYQGAITVLAQVLAPVLSDAAVAEMTCVGSLLILAIGLNLLKVTKIKVLDFILAIFLPIGLVLFM